MTRGRGAEEIVQAPETAAMARGGTSVGAMPSTPQQHGIEDTMSAVFIASPSFTLKDFNSSPSKTCPNSLPGICGAFLLAPVAKST